MAENKKSFEEALAELELIVEKLEKGECGLDESISLYERGIKLSADCSNLLTEARNKILTLSDAEVENDA